MECLGRAVRRGLRLAWGRKEEFAYGGPLVGGRSLAAAKLLVLSHHWGGGLGVPHNMILSLLGLLSSVAIV